MADLPRILLQLDPDPHPSSFDAVVAVDAGVTQLLQYGNVVPADVRDLIYGAIFTRAPKDLQSTAVFIGGRDVAMGEQILSAVQKTFLGPLRVSVMLDANGANTTAAAAVLALVRHMRPPQPLTVLAATGSVGRRVVRLAAGLGFPVRVASRSLARAQEVVEQVERQLTEKSVPNVGTLHAHATDSEESLAEAVHDAVGIVAAGAPGVQLLRQRQRGLAPAMQVVIDLNAVPPLGIEGVEVTARDVVQPQDIHAYGAIGIGGIKMPLHRAAIGELFQGQDRLLDAEEILALGRTLI